MYCHKCGHKIKDDSAFCSHCGAKTEKKDNHEKANASPTTSIWVEGNTSNSKKFQTKLIAIFIALVLILIGTFSGKKTDESSDANNSTILYKGKAILTLMDKNSEEIENLFGTPQGGTPVTGELLFGGTAYYTYDGISFWFDEQDNVFTISANADSLKIGKTSLDQTREELINILGEPTNELEGDDFHIMEYLVSEDTYLLTINMFDTESSPFSITITYPYDMIEDAYDEESTFDSVLDPELIGRWRSADGGILEFDEWGSVLNCDIKCWSITDYGRANNGAPDRLRWEASNGRVTCYSEFDYDQPYQFSTSHTEYGYLEGVSPPEYEILSIGKKNSMIAWFRRNDESPEGSGLVGTWVDDNLPLWTWQFNSDGTGIYNGKFNYTWNAYATESNENRISYTLYDTASFDYYITGDVLTVFLSDGSQTYTKVGN